METFYINKLLAEIVAGLIPFKLARNRWRGILRYGIFRALKLQFQIKRNKTAPKHGLAICAIAKNEGPYFEEWIEWHRNLGVDKFYIYDNESSDNTRDVLKPYIESGLVDYTFFPGKKQQLPAYDDCLEKHRFDARWIAIIDLDEFIVPMQGQTILEYLKPLETYSAVEINWLIYGSSGLKAKEPGTVMQRFKRHSQLDCIHNRTVKSIVNPRKVFCVIGCHEVARISGKTADSHGQPVAKHFRDRDPQHDVIRINHYAVKSYDEFLGKRARGRARTANQRTLDYFKKYDLNDVEEG